jgi:hypothetical protein
MLKTGSCDNVDGLTRVAEDFPASQLSAATLMLWDAQEDDVATLNRLRVYPLRLTSDIGFRTRDWPMKSVPTRTQPSVI